MSPKNCLLRAFRKGFHPISEEHDLQEKISTIHDHQSSVGKISTHLSIRVLLIGSQDNTS